MPGINTLKKCLRIVASIATRSVRKRLSCAVGPGAFSKIQTQSIKGKKKSIPVKKGIQNSST
ncbi:hypothetical protein D3C81_985880 [compost metagenome]